MAAPLSEISSIIRDVLHDNDLKLAVSTCFDDLPDWNLISVVVEIECRLDLQFELSEIDHLTTIGDLLQAVTAKQALSMA